MPKLKNTLDQINKVPQKQRQAARQDLSDTVGGHTDILRSSLTEALDASQRASSAERGKIANAVVSQIMKTMEQAHNALLRRIDALELANSELQTLSRDNLKTLLGGTEGAVMQNLQDASKRIEALGEQIAGLPTDIPQTDTSVIEGLVLAAMEKIDGIQMPTIPKPPRQKRKWEFTVLRDDEDLIKKVVIN